MLFILNTIIAVLLFTEQLLPVVVKKAECVDQKQGLDMLDHFSVRSAGKKLIL